MRMIGPTSRSLARNGSDPSTIADLLRRNQIELARTFLIEQRSLFLIAAAPVFMSAGDAYKIARADTLFAGIVFVEIGSLNDHDPRVIRMRVHTVVLSGIELAEGRVCTLIGIAPDRRGRYSLGAWLVVGFSG